MNRQSYINRYKKPLIEFDESISFAKQYLQALANGEGIIGTRDQFEIMNAQLEKMGYSSINWDSLEIINE